MFYYMAFVKLTKQLLMFFHLLDLYILSAVGTPTYNIAKFLVPILSCLTINKFTVKNSFSFAKEMAEQDSSFYVGSLDGDSLFTNIPLEEI